MPVPYTFANQTGVIPLSELDQNFAALSGAVPAFANTAGTVTQSNQSNITGVGVLQNLTVAGNITAGSVTAAAINGTLQVGIQPNITQVGNLVNLVVSNAITTSSIISASLVGQLVTAQQPVITQVGTLDSLSVANGISGVLTTGSQPNITAVGNLATLTVVGNVSAGNIQASGVSGTLRTNAQPNITSLGVLESLAVTGTVSAATLSSTELVSGRIQSLGNVSAQLVTSSGNMSAAGNVITAGSVIAGGNIVAQVQGFEIGYRNSPQIPLASSTTISINDGGKHYYYNLQSNIVITIPLNNSVPLPVGTTIMVINESLANITLAPAFGAALFLAGNSNSSNRVVSSFGVANLIKVQNDIWFVYGTGVV